MRLGLFSMERRQLRKVVIEGYKVMLHGESG